jgi:glucose-6-phosphate 1-epimerase
MAHITETTGRSDLPVVQLHHSEGTHCEVYLHGATVTACSLSGKQLIFVSEEAVWDGTKPIRGGIPLVFPQFGQPNASMPSHGVARTQQWSVLDTFVDDLTEDVVALLQLQDNEETRAVFPHNFELRYELRLNPKSLSCKLMISNTGDSEFACHALLHTYFHISDISNITVRGFEGCTYIDKLQDNAKLTEMRASIAITQETDSIYTNEASDIPDIVIIDSAYQHEIRVQKSATRRDQRDVDTPVPCDTVLWNPWVEKAARLADIGDNEYHNFVCVEPGTVSQWVSLPPSESLILWQNLSIRAAADSEETKAAV